MGVLSKQNVGGCGALVELRTLVQTFKCQTFNPLPRVVSALLPNNPIKQRIIGGRDRQTVAVDGAANILPVEIEKVGRCLHLIRRNPARPVQPQTASLKRNG